MKLPDASCYYCDSICPEDLDSHESMCDNCLVLESSRTPIVHMYEGGISVKIVAMPQKDFLITLTRDEDNWVSRELKHDVKSAKRKAKDMFRSYLARTY